MLSSPWSPNSPHGRQAAKLYANYAQLLNALCINNIRIVQQTFPDLPCNLEYTQTMKLDLIRIGEMKPFH